MLAWLDHGRPVVRSKAAGNAGAAWPACSISRLPRWSNQAMAGPDGRPAPPSSTPLSAMPATPTARTRTGPQADSASRTARPITSTARPRSWYGSISVCPPLPVRHGVGCSTDGALPCDRDRATALADVVPISRPMTTSARGVMGGAPLSRVR